MDSARTWTPSQGDVYRQPSNANKAEDTPVEKSLPANEEEGAKTKNSSLEVELQQLAEDSFFRHLKYGADYIDEKPITGQPGNFHVASTGRMEKPVKPPILPVKTEGIGNLGLSGPAAGKNVKDVKKDGKPEKSPRQPNAPKLKRRKSKPGPVSPTG